MTFEEIDQRLKQINRPRLENFRDVLQPTKVAEVQTQKAVWDLAHPELFAEWQSLVDLEASMQRAAEEAKRLDAEKSWRLESIRRLVGDRISNNLHAPRDEPPLVAARQWLESEAWALSMMGNKGSGKTFAAAWAVLQLERIWPVVWLHSPTACARPLYGTKAQSDMDRAQKAPLFVLDEFGAELVSAPWMTQLEAILGIRYANGLKTIVTSNLTKEDFEKRMGERLADRLREGLQFVASGPSLRKRGVTSVRP